MTSQSEFRPLPDLKGQVAVISGGTGAIGYACAKRLAGLGATCVLLGLNATPQKVDKFLSDLDGGGHLFIRVDVTQSASLLHAAEEVQREFGKVNILVNSAGSTRAIPVHDLQALHDDLFDEMLRVNLRSVFSTIRAFAPLLQESGDGLVLNISSIASFTGVGSNLAYVAAKAGLDAIGIALARSLAPGVRVLTVAPGVVDTGFVPGRGADFNDKVAATLPLRRIGTADDVAATVEACATHLRYATGIRLVVDGGRHL